MSSSVSTRSPVGNSTLAAEIPPGHPFGDWTDSDFQQFEQHMAAHHNSRTADIILVDGLPLTRSEFRSRLSRECQPVRDPDEDTGDDWDGEEE